MTRSLALRGLDWVNDRPLGDTMAAFVTKGSDYARRFLHRHDDPATWSLLLADRRTRRFDPALGEALEAHHRRLGAPARALANVAALARGEAFAVVAGQQPGPLGGPLYTWHKTWTAVVLAKRLSAQLGETVVPVYWNATEDADFDEIAGATWARQDLALEHGSLPREARADGRLVGSLPAGLAAGVWHAARGAWHAEPGSARAYALLDQAARVAEGGGDLGDVVAKLLLEAFQDDGLVVVDPRLPQFRAAALPLYDRYVTAHADVRRVIDDAGDGIEQLGLKRGFTTAQTEFALFEADGDTRRHLAAREGAAALARARAAAPDRGPGLVPGAALRPIAQDFVLPALALVAGPGEVAYLAQVEPAARALSVLSSAIVPRWSATWLPPAAVALCADAGIEPRELVRAPDRALESYFASGVPEALARPLAELRAHTEAVFARLAAEAPALDRSLPELVRATARRVDWRLGRLGEGFARKARRAWKREHPEGPHLAGYVRPRGALQERTLAWLDVVARGGRAAEAAARAAATAHVERALLGKPPVHDVLAIETDRG